MTVLDNIRGLSAKALNGTSFWCDTFHQQVLTQLCIGRFKQGKAKCAGCEIGRALIQAEISKIKTETKEIGHG